MYAAPGQPYGRTRGTGLRPGVPVPGPVATWKLTRPTLAAIPVPVGESVYADKFRAAAMVGAAQEAGAARAAAIMAPYVAADAAVLDAKQRAMAPMHARTLALQDALAAAAIPKTDRRVAQEREAAAARATGRERGRLQQAIRARGVFPVVDTATGLVRVLDAASDPIVAAAYRRRQASSYRPARPIPAHVEAALAPSPADAAAAAALGTGAPSPQAVVQRFVDTATGGHGMGYTQRGSGFGAVAGPVTPTAGARAVVDAALTAAYGTVSVVPWTLDADGSTVTLITTGGQSVRFGFGRGTLTDFPPALGIAPDAAGDVAGGAAAATGTGLGIGTLALLALGAFFLLRK